MISFIDIRSLVIDDDYGAGLELPVLDLKMPQDIN